MTAAEPVDWETTLDLARTLAEACEHAHAAAVLAPALSLLDPATTGPDDRVIEAAVLYARTVDPTPDLVPDDVAWARYAHRAARTLHGPEHLITIDAAGALATALANHERIPEAEQIHRGLIQLHLDRGDVEEHLVARMDLAELCHDTGRCGDAAREAIAAWDQWITCYDPTSGYSVGIAMRLTWMLIACGRVTEARDVALAADLRPLEPTDAAYDALLLMQHSLFASLLHHQSVCARRLDATLTPRPAHDPAGEGKLTRDQRGEDDETRPR